MAVEKIPGVDSVRVSLNEGYAKVFLAPDNSATVELVRETIRHNGFTPKEAYLRVVGTVTASDGEPVLAVPGLGVPFRLVAHPDAAAQVAELAKMPPDRVVAVEGVVGETTDGAKPFFPLQVLRFAPAGG